VSSDDGETVDATRRTRLANERTYLAWWRTALAAFAVGLGVGKVVPELSDRTAWPFEVLGVGYVALEIALVVYSNRRLSAVERALDGGDYVGIDPAVPMVLSTAGILLGLGTIAALVA